MYKRKDFHHLTNSSLWLSWGLQQVGVPFSLVTSEAFKTDHSSTLGELPGDLRSLRPCQHNPQLDCGEIPRAPEHGVHTAGVTVIYSHPLLE